MEKKVTMFANDRERLRVAAGLLEHVSELLDSISHDGVQSVVDDLYGLVKRLNRIDSTQVTHQLAPGEIRP